MWSQGLAVIKQHSCWIGAARQTSPRLKFVLGQSIVGCLGMFVLRRLHSKARCSCAHKWQIHQRASSSLPCCCFG